MKLEIRNVKKEDEKEVIKILLDMQKLHINGRKDIFKKENSKTAKEEFLSILNDNKKEMVVAIDKNDKVRGLSYCFF